jgi:histidine kinase
MLFAIPVSLLSALVISLAFSRRFIKPINTMVAASRRIGEGKYSERIPLPGRTKVEEMDELNQLAVSFNQMAGKLEKIEELRKKLIGDVSHELRTPLAYIKGSMEGLIDGVVSPSEKTFYQIQVEAERLAKLVDDLQELSRIEEGAYTLNKTRGDINRVIEQVIGILSPRYQGKNVAIVTDFKPDAITADFDADRIKQVLSNLLSNAFKYSRREGRVSITSRISGDNIQVDIADEGIGISKKDLPFIFTRFFRADKSRSRSSGGSGIGLTIAKRLVEAHGGRIWAQSDGANKGATFSFTIPIK